MIALHDAVQDGVGDGGIADPGVPVLDRQLAGDDGALGAGAVVDDLQKVRARHAVDGAHTSIVQHKYIGLRQLQQPLAEGATAVADAQFFLQTGMRW